MGAGRGHRDPPGVTQCLLRNTGEVEVCIPALKLELGVGLSVEDALGFSLRLVRFKKVGLWIGVGTGLGYARKRIWEGSVQCRSAEHYVSQR